MNNFEELKEEFENITLIKCFEERVLTKTSKDECYIIFDISIFNNELIAEHESLTIEQENSDKIAFESIPLDDCFSLDEHLQNLYSECISAIIESDFYELP